MNVDQWPDCLGCSDEPSRQQAVFPKTLDGETRTESPVGLYSDPARWCERCWILWEQFDRFHLLYSRRLMTYTRTLLIHLPPGQREMAVDDVTAEALEALWKQREKLRVPERAMYRMAQRMAWARFPSDPKETPADLLEGEEDIEDPINALVDASFWKTNSPNSHGKHGSTSGSTRDSAKRPRKWRPTTACPRAR